MADRWKGILSRALGGKSEERYHVDAPDAAAGIARTLSGFGQELIDERDAVLLVCVGTDRSIGDALGPLVGTLLEERGATPFKVLGTLDQPVHASNLSDTLQRIENEYRRPLVVAVDACLGRMESVGTVTVARGPLRPGAGVNKSLPTVGQLHVTGVVNVGGFMEYFVLQNTRLNLVMRMAKVIAHGVSQGLHTLSPGVDNGGGNVGAN